MKNIKFVYFDFGGVLAHWMPGVPRLAKLFNVPEEDLFTTLYDHFPDANRGIISADEMWKRIKADLNVQHEHDSYPKYYAESFVPIQETHALARELKKTHKVGVMSNIESDTLQHSMSLGHAGNVEYDVVLESNEIGYIKPELAFFKEAQKRAGVHSNEILFTDDLMENVDAAKKMGWHAIQFDTFNPSKSVKEIKEYMSC